MKLELGKTDTINFKAFTKISKTKIGKITDP